MRILFLSHYFPPEGNAPATRVHQFCKRWVEAGHEVTVITCAPNVPSGVVYDGYKNRLYQREVVDGISVIRIWTYLAANAGTARRMLNFTSYLNSAFWAGLFRKRPDVLIATSPQMFCGVAGALLRLFKRCPFVLEVRDIWPESILTVGAMKKSLMIRGLEKVERWMYRRADHIVAVGPGYQRKLVERGVPESKISIVTNGVDLSLYTPRPADPAWRERYGVSDKIAIAYIGTVGMAAGLETVLEAGKILKARGVDGVRFLVVGDGAERANLERQREAEGVDNVSFTGFLPKTEMATALASVDVCLVHLRDTPLFQTVLPSKIFEAAAMERPILMAVGGDAAELIREAGAGVIVRGSDPAAMADAAELLASSAEERARMGRAGASRLAPQFDADKLARGYLELLEQIVNRR